jgi:hypothetical protein
MKKAVLSAIAIISISQLADASPIQTAIIPSTGPSLTVTVASGQDLKILNFVDDNVSGAVTATVTIGSLTAGFSKSLLVGATQPVTANIAGPATVTVPRPAVGNVVISYQLVSNF